MEFSSPIVSHELSSRHSTRMLEAPYCRSQELCSGLLARSPPVSKQGSVTTHSTKKIPPRGEWGQHFTRWYEEVLEQEEKLQDVIRSYPSAPLLFWCPHCMKENGVESRSTARESNRVSHGNHRRPSLKAAFDFIAQLGSGAMSKVGRRSWKRCRTKRSEESMVSALNDNVSYNALSPQELDGLLYQPELQDSKLRIYGRELEEMILESNPHAAELPTYPPVYEMSGGKILVELPAEVDYPLVHDKTSVSVAIPALQKSVLNDTSERSRRHSDSKPYLLPHHIHVPSRILEPRLYSASLLTEDNISTRTDHIIGEMSHDGHMMGGAVSNIPHSNKVSPQHVLSSWTTNIENSCETDFGSPKSESQYVLLKDFFQVLRHLFKLSHDKLSQPTISGEITLFMKRKPKPEVLARIGLVALQKTLSGTAEDLPKGDMEIYALLHVAYACALTTYLYPVAITYNALYNNALEWTLAAEPLEQTNLAAIIQQLWGPPPGQTEAPSQAIGVHNNFPNMDGPDKADCISSHSVDSSASSLWLDSAAQCTSPVAYTQDSNDLLNNLRKGKAIVMCKQFFDIVEYATLANGPRSPYLGLDWQTSKDAARALLIQQGVTLPLINHAGRDGSILHYIDPLVQKIREADSLLNCGRSLSLRELELKLIHDARIIMRCPRLHDTFLRQVSNLCDATCPTIGLDPLSRDHYYLKDISDALLVLDAAHGDNILGFCALKRPWDNDFVVPSCVSQTSTPTTKRTSSNTSSSTMQSSGTKQSSIGTTPNYIQTEEHIKEMTLAGDFTSIGKPSFVWDAGCHIKSDLPPIRTKSDSPESPLSNIASSSVYCPDCLQPFGGTERSAKQNLSRHKKTVCSGQPPQYICEYSSCDKSYNRRDNLMAHQRREGHSGEPVGSIK